MGPRPASPRSRGAEDNVATLHHSTTLEHFGKSFWSNGAPQRPVAAVEDLLGPITRLAPHLDVASVGAATPGSSEKHFLVSGQYALMRHLWQRYVSDAAYAQLLTDHHMEHLGDLSAWHVTEVAPGRHLVRWPVVEDWFSEPDPRTGRIPPDPAVLDQAPHDFAALLPTREALQAHPLRPPNPA